MRVDALLAADEVVHLVGADLHEWSFRRGGRGGIEVLIGGVVHDVLPFDVINLWCPEPLRLRCVGFAKGLSLVLPRAEVVRRVASDAAGIVGAVGIVRVAVEQDVGVGQGNLALAAFGQRKGIHRSRQGEKEEKEREGKDEARSDVVVHSRWFLLTFILI